MHVFHLLQFDLHPCFFFYYLCADLEIFSLGSFTDLNFQKLYLFYLYILFYIYYIYIYIYFFFSDITLKSSKFLLKKTFFHEIENSTKFSTIFTLDRILKFRALPYVRILWVYIKKILRKKKKKKEIYRQKKYCLSIESLVNEQIISIQNSLSILFKRNNSLTAHKSNPIICICIMSRTHFHLTYISDKERSNRFSRWFAFHGRSKSYTVIFPDSLTLKYRKYRSNFLSVFPFYL